MATRSTNRARTAPRPAGRRRFVRCWSAGKTHPATKVGRYEVCPTPNQREVLFGGGNPEKIGCGVFGCAFEYPKDPSKVVKVTVDAEDVSGLIGSQDVEHVARVYDSWQLAQGVRTVASRAKQEDRSWMSRPWGAGPSPAGVKHPAYAVVVERLKPVPKEDKRWMAKVLSVVTRRHGNVSEEELVKACPRSKAKREEAAKCFIFAGEVADTARELQDYGAEWRDAHVGNIGIDRDGKWKILDLGLSRHRGNEPYDMLERPARFRRLARRLRRL
jgi:hypothetical protein